MWLSDKSHAFRSLTPARRLTTTAMLIAMALVLSWLERMLPAELVAPIPGIKLGLPNVVTLFALVYADRRCALTVMALRTLLASALFGTVTSFVFSFTGGLFAFAVMALMLPRRGRWFSDLGISVAGAALHNTGQVCAAAVVMGTYRVFVYLGVLLLASLVTGVLIGAVFAALSRQLESILPRLLPGEKGRDT